MDAHKAYQYWIQKRTNDGVTLNDRRGRQARLWQKEFLFEFVFFASAQDELSLMQSLNSLALQDYPHWKATIISTVPSFFDGVDETKIVWIRSDDPHVALVEAMLNSHADFIGLIACGIQFASYLLSSIGDWVALNPHWGVVYFDEDQFLGAFPSPENREKPAFKPDFDRDYFYSYDYVKDFFVRRELLLPWLSEHTWQQDQNANYRLLLGVLEKKGERAIGHVPDVLLHVPAHCFFGAEGEGATQALSLHLANSGEKASVLSGLVLGLTRRVIWHHAEKPLVSIIIPSKNHLAFISACVKSLFEKTAYPNWELVIVDNGSDEPEVLAFYQALLARRPDKIKILSFPGPFDYSAMNNAAVQEAKGHYFLFLNNDIECLEPSWLDAMMSHAQREEIGVVGAKLLFPNDESIQHAGCVLGLSGTSDHPFLRIKSDQVGYLFSLAVDRGFSAVTGACQLVRASLFWKVGGFSQARYRIACSDIDLCLKIKKLGFKVLFSPFAVLYHHHSASLREEILFNPAKREEIEAILLEQEMFASEWQEETSNDPHWNPHLSLNVMAPFVEFNFDTPWDRPFHDRPRVLAVPIKARAVAEYRQIMPLRALYHQEKIHYASLLPPLADYEKAASVAELTRMAPDTIFMHYPIDDLRLQALERYAGACRSIFRVYSMDDLVHKLPEYNPAYKVLPQKMTSERLRRGFALSDRLIVSTQPLKETYASFIEDIRVIPNALDFSIWENLGQRPQTEARGGKIRVGWAGAQQHSGDLLFLKEVVEATHHVVDWVFMGMSPEGVDHLIYENHPFEGDFFAYPAKLAALHLDLAVAPLVSNEFNEAKSNLKLLEYGILGWPVICSDLYPYQTQNPPVTRLQNKRDLWVSAILDRVKERDALEKEGTQLKAWVKNYYLLEQHLAAWHAALLR